MTDDFESVLAVRTGLAGRPLFGTTLLLVEDSRFASEAMRLLCLRSGARLRRADSLRSARRHLATYRPTALIVDFWLPDGSGAELIEEAARAVPRIPAIIAVSGDPAAEAPARAAGADAFIAKPIGSLRAFQTCLLRLVAAGRKADTSEDFVPDPDRTALTDDLAAAAEVLERTPESAGAAPTLDYLAHFVAGLAVSTGDAPLAQAADILTAGARAGRVTPEHRAEVGRILRGRIAETPPI